MKLFEAPGTLCWEGSGQVHRLCSSSILGSCDERSAPIFCSPHDDELVRWLAEPYVLHGAWPSVDLRGNRELCVPDLHAPRHPIIVRQTL